MGNKEAVARLQVVAEEGNMPNLILSVCANLHRCCKILLSTDCLNIRERSETQRRAAHRDRLAPEKQHPLCAWREPCWGLHTKTLS